jgi:hypothetical protein|tara:strand:+ start:1386 stop:1658 length:273 start_codon:yes stop_codon:yes gene_type:complete
MTYCKDCFIIAKKRDQIAGRMALDAIKNAADPIEEKETKVPVAQWSCDHAFKGELSICDCGMWEQQFWYSINEPCVASKHINRIGELNGS